MAATLPDPEDRDWLLDQLAELVSRAGWRNLVLAPVVEPDDRFFPDPWEPGPRGVQRLARRLLRYAGLGELEVHVEDVRMPGAVDESSRHTEPGVWLEGIDDGVATFQLQRLAEPDAVAGALAHEVARAFRVHRQLEAPEGAPYRGRATVTGDTRARETLEEQLTSLTSVYLGLGVLTTTAAHRYVQTGYMQGYLGVSKWTHSRIGGLPAEAMSFLLAAQAVARGLGRKERARLTRRLPANQAVDFHAAADVLERQGRDALVNRLGLPPPSEWPAPRRVEVPPLDETGRGSRDDRVSSDGDATTGAREGAAEDDEARANEGRPVFRVPVRHTGRGLVLGGAVGVAAFAALTGAIASPSVALLVPLGMATGALVGARARHFECSDPACAAPLGPTATTCPRCGGVVSGRIARRTDRLAAEEALEARSRGPSADE